MHGPVVSDEFERRKGYICALPFNGVTVSARGEITLCCATPNAPLGNLKDVSDLNDFYNGAEMDYFRTEMQEGRIGALSGCVDCFKKYSQGHWSVMTCANEQQWPAMAKTFDADWHSRKQGKGAPLRFLE